MRGANRLARRGRAGRLLLALTVLLGTLALAPAPVLSAAEPNVPACPPGETNKPLPGSEDPPNDCVGSRLLDFSAPVFPAGFAFDEVLSFYWPEVCTHDETQSDNVKCIYKWNIRFTYYMENADGSLSQLYWSQFHTNFATDDPGCEPVVNYCHLIVRADPGVPDEVTVVMSIEGESVFCKPETGFTGCNSTDRPWMSVAQNVGEIEEPPPGLEVTLEAFSGGDGSPLNGVISVAQTIRARLTLSNETEAPLSDIRFTRGVPLVIDERGTGGLAITSGPSPPIDPNLTLGPNEEVSFEYELEATAEGVAAAHTQVIAAAPDGSELKEAHSLRFDIADGVKITREVGQWLRMQAVDDLMQRSFAVWHRGMADRGQRLAGELAKIFTPEQRLRWFGSETEFPLSPSDFALALLRGTAAEMVAAITPKSVPSGGPTEDQMKRAYAETFKEVVGKGASDYVKNYADLGKATKKFVQDSWSEAMLNANYLASTATREERAQWEAFAMTMVDGSIGDAKNMFNTVKTEIPRWRENGTYFLQALEELEAMGGVKGFMGSVAKIDKVIADEGAWRAKTLELAQTDPIAFQRQWAKRDAEILNLALPTLFDTLLGGGVVSGGGLLKKVVFRGKGASIVRAGQAAGVLDEGGNVAKGASAIDKPSPDLPHGLPNGTVAELGRADPFFSNVEGATVVRSSDLGDVYSLPNLGGVPEITLDAKAGILKKLEDDYFDKTGKRIQLVEVLKPSSPLRKTNSTAKLEMTAQKTGKPAMMDAGAPPDLLAEAGVWTGPDPKTLPGFDDLPKLRQEAAVEEWNEANKAWAIFENPPPGSKEARLLECIGERKRVPLDLTPTQGLQRFVTAEFEVIPVTHGQAQGKLIRVKYYEIEVVDTNRNVVVNRRTVVGKPGQKPNGEFEWQALDEAVPQGPDADAVAVGKVVGTDASGQPTFGPLDRAEKEFVMPRYVDLNVKARRLPPGEAGAIKDAAEHGATLVMNDASAVNAGKLIPVHGLVYVPEGPGIAYLRKIAPFVTGLKKPSTEQIEQMFQQMLALVHKKGGFGQHAVVVTSHNRYFGAVPFADW